MKSKMIIFFTSLLLSVFLTCGSVFAEEKVALKFTDWQGGNTGILNAYKEIISIFEKENPGFTVDYQQYSINTYNEFLKPSLAGGNAPDLLAVYPGPDAIEVVRAGALVDLKPHIDAEWKSWLGASYNFKGINIEGGIYLIPQDVFTEGIWYHKDMLKEIGWEPKSTTDSFSVEDYIAMAKAAKGKGFDVMLAGFIEGWCYTDPFFNFVHQQQPSESPDMVDQAMAGKISWQQDIFRNSIEVFVKLHKAGVWKQDALSMDYQVQAFGKWLEKKAIFMWGQGDWFASSMKKADNNYENPNIGIIQFPLVNKNSTVAFNKNLGTDIGVSTKTKYQKQAISFTRLTNSPRAAKIFIKNGVNPAAGVDAANVPKTDNPVFDEGIKLYNSPGRYSEIYYYYPDVVKAIGDGIGSVLLDVESIDDVLAHLDEVSGFKQ
jgi:ABC-type glycerol-3-phosphate transport system substrate-binding protein